MLKVSGRSVLVNCDACEDFSGEFRSENLMWSADGSSEYEEGFFEGCPEDEEGLGDVMSAIFMSSESMFFMW